MNLAQNIIPLRETDCRAEARAACQAIRIMLERDFALAEQLGVTVFHGGSAGSKIILSFDKLKFHHEDIN